MPGTTTHHFMIEAKFGSAVIGGTSLTNNFKQVILTQGSKVDLISGSGLKTPMQAASVSTSAISIENKAGVALTVVVLMAEKTFKGVPSGFYNPLVLEGKVVQLSQKGETVYFITALHPVTKALECTLALHVSNFGQLNTITG